LAVGLPDCQALQLAGAIHAYRSPVNNDRWIPVHTRGYGVMKIRPLQDRILVKRVDEEATTAGGIIIPDTAKEKPQEGKVISTGNGKAGDDGNVVPLEVKKGDRVLFSKYAGTEVNIESEEHLIIREEDVLGILE
jgi:chaperonin GroES